MMDKVLATLIMWIIGAPIYLPGLLARLGIYKNWYLLPFMPPFVWRGFIYMWPFSAFFVCAPFMALLPVNEDERLEILVGISIIAAIFAIILALWRPGWAKPTWQRRLEEQYEWEEINQVFIPAWRKMSRKRWSQLIETEEGLESLVRIARGQRY